MTTKTSIELVMEAVAGSDQVTLEDMEKMDIREKLVLNYDSLCPICMLGLNETHKKCNSMSELDKIMQKRKLESKEDVVKTIEEIYYNPVASIEAITFISTLDSEKLFNMVMAAIKKDPAFKILLMLALSK